MLRLLQNELMKIFVRPGTYVMIGLLLLMVSVAGGVLKYQENQAGNAGIVKIGSKFSKPKLTKEEQS